MQPLHNCLNFARRRREFHHWIQSIVYTGSVDQLAHSSDFNVDLVTIGSEQRFVGRGSCGTDLDTPLIGEEPDFRCWAMIVNEKSDSANITPTTRVLIWAACIEKFLWPAVKKCDGRSLRETLAILRHCVWAIQ